MAVRASRVVFVVLPLLLAGGGAWWWFSREAPPVAEDPLAPAALDRRLLAVEQSLARLARGQSRNEQRLADLEARSRVQREELLGWGQRIGLLDESVQQMAGATQGPGATSLRLDEVELLLTFGEARIALSGDIDAARRAYALADELLAALTAPKYVNLRQALAQEQAALAALPPDPRIAAREGLAALDAALAGLSDRPAPPKAGPEGTPLARFLEAVVDVRPRAELELAAPADRQRAESALRLELGLARMAIETRDDAALAAAVGRAKAWLDRLYAENESKREAVGQLDALASRPLRVSPALVGSTLAQLRAQRRAEGGG